MSKGAIVLHILLLPFNLILVNSSLIVENSSTNHTLGAYISEAANEDADLTFTELTLKYGYKSEVHTVTTEDGYVLTLFRIPGGKNCSGQVKRRPVVLMHGLADNADTFIIASPGTVPGYLLADLCHDVWCPNHRGNRYSRGHRTLRPTQPAFWNFTYDEHGARDLPAILDYVLNVTGASTLDYVGHSQGTTDLLILNSVKPEYNEKINVAILLAPVAWMKHIPNLLLKAVSKLTEEIKMLMDMFGEYRIFGVVTIPSKLLELACHYVPEVLCDPPLYILTGLYPSRVQRETLSAAFGHYPDSTSVKNLVHFGQGIRVDKFRRYDYGSSDANMVVYNQSEPPDYNVSKVTAKVVLMLGVSDWLVGGKDVETLMSKLPNVLEKYIIPDEAWSHAEFVWGKRIPDILMPKIVQYLNLYK